MTSSISGMQSDFQILDELMTAVRDLPMQEPLRETVFSIAGFPRRELVFSNILAFFLEDRDHCFGNMWLESLKEVVPENSILGTHVENVQREVSTRSGKRIDLVIETDLDVIGIENKIDALETNDMDDYSEHITLLANEVEKNATLLWLCVRPEQPQGSRPFARILYSQLFDRVRAKVGNHLETAEPRHLWLMQDFMEAIERLTRSKPLEPRTTAFFQEHYESLLHLDRAKGLYTEQVKQLLEGVEAAVQGRMESYFADLPSPAGLSFSASKKYGDRTTTEAGLYRSLLLAFEPAADTWESSLLGRTTKAAGLEQPGKIAIEMWMDDKFRAAILDGSKSSEARKVARIEALRRLQIAELQRLDPFEATFFGMGRDRKGNGQFTTVAVGDISDVETMADTAMRAVDVLVRLTRPYDEK